MFLLDRSALACDVVKMILEKLDIAEPDIVQPMCALFQSDNGTAINDALADDTEVLQVVQSWEENQGAKLVFMIRLFLKNYIGLQYREIVAQRLDKETSSLTLDDYLENAEVRDAQLLHLQYIQAVYSIISGQYLTTPEEALQLGALQFLFKFGEYKQTRHAAGFLGSRIVEFIPARHLRHKTLEQWEEDFADSLSAVHNNRPAGGLGTTIDPQRRYIESVMRLSGGNMFGTTFFRCTQTQFRSMPSTLLIGVHSAGVNICDISRQLIRQYSILELSRWGYKVGTLFYMEVSSLGESAVTLEFDTSEGEVIADILSDYATQYMEEKTRAEERLQLLKPKSVASQRSSVVKKVAYADEPNTPPPPIKNAAKPSNSEPPGPPPPSILKAPSMAPPPPKATPPPVRAATDRRVSTKDIAAANALRAKQNAAAAKIQALYRGFALRNEWSKEGAVILIQAIVRGHLQRCRLARMIEEMFASGQISMYQEGDG